MCGLTILSTFASWGHIPSTLYSQNSSSKLRPSHSDPYSPGHPQSAVCRHLILGTSQNETEQWCFSLHPFCSMSLGSCELYHIRTLCQVSLCYGGFLPMLWRVPPCCSTFHMPLKAWNIPPFIGPFYTFSCVSWDV